MASQGLNSLVGRSPYCTCITGTIRYSQYTVRVGKLEKVVCSLGGGLRKVRKVVAGRMAEVRKEFGDEADAF